MLKTKFDKDIIELEYKKLLSEYSALLIALASVTLGVAGLIYTLKHDAKLSLFGLMFTYFVITVLRQEKAEELNRKTEQLRNL